MYSKIPSSFKRPGLRLAVKLTLWYSLFFLASMFGLHLLEFEVLDDEMRLEWEVTNARIRETWSVGEELPDSESLEIGKSRTTVDGRIPNRQQIYNHFGSVMIHLAVPALILGTIGGLLIMWRSFRPVRRIIRTVNGILNTGDMSVRVPARTGRGGFEKLVSLINRLIEKNDDLIVAMRQSLDNVAHDLRTPMTRLRGKAEFALQETGNDDTCRDALIDCMEESERVLGMLNTVMDLAEAETGTMQLDRTDFGVADLVHSIVDLYEYVAEESRVTLNVDIPEGLVVHADRPRLQQALANLVDNAIKYSKPDTNVDIRAHRQEDRTVITIRDQGFGIPLEDQPRIWQRLYRGDRSRSKRGLGLGLNLVKAMIEAHGGTVGVTSEPNQGSTFTIELPVWRGEPMPIEPS